MPLVSRRSYGHHPSPRDIFQLVHLDLPILTEQVLHCYITKIIRMKILRSNSRKPFVFACTTLLGGEQMLVGHFFYC